MFCLSLRRSGAPELALQLRILRLAHGHMVRLGLPLQNFAEIVRECEGRVRIF